MERTETPLDVLSRAASLVETSEAVVNFSEKQESDLSTTSRILKQRRQDFGCVSSKYRDHRTAGTQTSMSMMNNNEETRQNNKRARLENLKQEIQNSSEDDDSVDDSSEFCDDDSPLDMTTTNRNSSANKNSANPGLLQQQQQRPSVIQCAPTLFNQDKSKKDFSENNRTSSQKILSNRYNEIRHGHRREILSGMCDPVIDEHFRRSLGKDYPEYFSSPPVTNSVSISGLSVDDHFAKALGEKWHQIQGKIETTDSKSSSSSNTNITTQASSPLVQQRHSILST